MKIAILYNTTEYLVRFRSELIRSLQALGCDLVVITPEDSSTSYLEELSVRWCEWKIDGQALNPVKDITSLVDLRQILKQERPDAILNFTIKPVLYGSLVASFLGVPRVVSMITGMGSVFMPGGFKRRLLLIMIHIVYRLALKRNQVVLFQNDDDLEYFKQHKFISPEAAVRINGSGVNLNIFSPSSLEYTPGSFLLISRMIKEKGIYEYIEAARIVKSMYSHANFTLVGPIDKNPGAITRKEIHEWEEEGIVSYMSLQEDVRPFLANAEVYVLPTYYYEGVPRSILEALAMGKPVITTDWRGCRDTVDHGVNGFLVPPKNSKALADAMVRFLADKSLSTRFGEESRRLAVESFDINDINEKIIEALKCSV